MYIYIHMYISMLIAMYAGKYYYQQPWLRQRENIMYVYATESLCFFDFAANKLSVAFKNKF